MNEQASAQCLAVVTVGQGRVKGRYLILPADLQAFLQRRRRPAAWESEAPEVEQAVISRVRDLLAAVPDTAVRVVRPVLFSFKTPIEVEVYGDELGRLKRKTDEVREVMASLPELADVESTLKTGAPEVEIVYDRDLLARYGLNIRQVALEIRNQVKGYEATRFNQRLAIEDEAHVGARPTDIDAERAIETCHASHERGAGHATSRAGERQRRRRPSGIDRVGGASPGTDHAR